MIVRKKEKKKLINKINYKKIRSMVRGNSDRNNKKIVIEIKIIIKVSTHAKVCHRTFLTPTRLCYI